MNWLEIGIGESQQPIETSMTMEDLAKVVYMLADYVKWKRFCLLGYFMGGMIALTAALNTSPGFKIEKLVLCSTTSKTIFSEYIEGLKSFDKQSFTPEQKKKFVLKMLEINFAKEWIEVNPSVYAQIVESEKKSTNRKSPAVIVKQTQAIDKFNAESELSDILIPTLILHGDKDNLIPIYNGEAIHRRMPNSKFVALENVGYLFYIEYPGSAKIIGAFLASEDYSISK
ncbi:12611_t:CDS:2 [Ambispora gerdemannii]|uniref:12611_t:CDS:1 n=1 Tax=Ambispora gerdemannii TaxID=144530 RepID=A0A9N9F6P2_9GLOM|nr:12611_t:CDS:2 [Ambispora gerdemannii]